MGGVGGDDVVEPTEVALIHADDVVVIGVVGTRHLACGMMREGDVLGG